MASIQQLKQVKELIDMKHPSLTQRIAVLGIFALLPVVMASAQNPVPRPFEMQANSRQVWQLDPTTGGPVQRLVAEGWGVATHCGLVGMAGDG